jgi:hypothetical protein
MQQYLPTQNQFLDLKNTIYGKNQTTLKFPNIRYNKITLSSHFFPFFVAVLTTQFGAFGGWALCPYKSMQIFKPEFP